MTPFCERRFDSVLKQVMKYETSFLSLSTFSVSLTTNATTENAQRKLNSFAIHYPAEWMTNPLCSECVSAVLAQLCVCSVVFCLL